ncbi:MAG: DUF2236 domain-containing protein [Chloroflexi bacterium]|nr:DUF2236 domain-containing protein [Chloroflexota bacterium]
MSRYARRDEIAALDPSTDYERIVYLVGAYESICNPAVARVRAVQDLRRRACFKLLAQTGEFTTRGQKRYDDTALIVSEIAEHGIDSERGHAAIRQMNRMHRRFDIANDDYLYVLGSFIYEPIRWNPVLAWRPSTEAERLANFYFWREVGKRMGIKDIPATYAEMESFYDAYEAAHFRYSPENAQIAEAAIHVFMNWFPRPLHPLIRSGIVALLDDRMRAAFGFRTPPAWWRWTVRRGLRLNAAITRLLPVRKRPYHFTGQRSRTYPNGYQIDQPRQRALEVAEKEILGWDAVPNPAGRLSPSGLFLADCPRVRGQSGDGGQGV